MAAASASSALFRPFVLLPLPPSSLPAATRFLSKNSFTSLLGAPSPLRLPRRSLWDSRSPSRRLSPVASAQSNFVKVIQTAWRIGRDVTDAGVNLVPNAVPRPIARIGIAVVAISIALFLLKSVVSTVFFVLAMSGLVYFVFVALNTDEVSRSSNESNISSEEETLEEARRIMEKYK